MSVEQCCDGDARRGLDRLRKPMLAGLFVLSTASAVAVTAMAYADTPVGGIGFERCALSYPKTGAPAGRATVALPGAVGVDTIEQQRPLILPAAVAASGLFASCRGANNTTRRVAFALTVDVVDTQGTVCLNDSDVAQAQVAPGDAAVVSFSAADSGCGTAEQLRVRWLARVLPAS